MKVRTLLALTFIWPLTGISQLSYVPDDGFEAYIEQSIFGASNGVANDDYVNTAALQNHPLLGLQFNQNISDLTGIQDFTSLMSLSLHNLSIQNIDLSGMVGSSQGPLGYLDISIIDCDLATQISLPQGDFGVSLSSNHSLTQLTFQPNSTIHGLNVQSSTSLIELDIEGVAGVQPGANLFIHFNPFLQCLKLANGSCSNWQLASFQDNQSLTCIQVDDPAYSQVAWSWLAQLFDPSLQYSTNCNCSLTIGIEEFQSTTNNSSIDGVFDLLGRETAFQTNTSLIIRYDDGSYRKVHVID